MQKEETIVTAAFDIDGVIINPQTIELFKGYIKDEYGEDLSADFALEFLAENHEEPCFVYYPMALPHWPMVPTPISDAVGNMKVIEAILKAAETNQWEAV